MLTVITRHIMNVKWSATLHLGQVAHVLCIVWQPVHVHPSTLVQASGIACYMEHNDNVISMIYSLYLSRGHCQTPQFDVPLPSNKGPLVSKHPGQLSEAKGGP